MRFACFPLPMADYGSPNEEWAKLVGLPPGKSILHQFRDFQEGIKTLNDEYFCIPTVVHSH